MLRLLLAIILLLSTSVWGAEHPYDTYYHATECPQNGPAYEDALTADANIFVRCQCTSYVAQKLSERMTARYYNNRAPANLVKNFQNDRYYMPQEDRNRWSHARYWRDAAIYAGIGVTGARDNFVWDEKSYNAVFPGDVAWWGAWDYVDAHGNRRKNQWGHVAIVESAEPDAAGRGVACVVLSEYNWVTHTFSRRRVCKTDGHSFPDAFLHIDRDHAYCTANPNQDNCRALWGGPMVASSGTKADGLGGGVGSNFNLKLDFDIMDPSDDIEWQAGVSPLRAGQTVRLLAEAEAKGGDVRYFMRRGKDTIEVDFYVREDDQDWTKLPRQYIKANNLRDGKKKEQVLYTVPAGVKQVSFKVKLDAEDEVYESNEGDNWSRIETFDIAEGPPTVNLIVPALEVPGKVSPGGEYRVRFALQNVGNSLPANSVRSVYQIRGPGTNHLWMNQTDDGTDRKELMPGRLQWEETKRPLRAPTIPGLYEQRVCTDHQHVEPETNEGDNCLTRFFTVEAPPLPDLVITFIEIDPWRDDSIQRGKTHYPTMKIKNVGLGPVTTTIRNTYYWCTTPSQCTPIDGDDTEASKLCVGCEVTETIKRGWKATQKGTFSLKACADTGGSQPETDEGNNCRLSGPIRVK